MKRLLLFISLVITLTSQAQYRYLSTEGETGYARGPLRTGGGLFFTTGGLPVVPTHLQNIPGLVVAGESVYRWSTASKSWIDIGAFTGTWGSITGSIAAQTDLVAALAAKQNLLPLGTSAQYRRGDHSLGDFTADVTVTARTAFSAGRGININNGVISNTDTVDRYITSLFVAGARFKSLYGVYNDGTYTPVASWEDLMDSTGNVGTSAVTSVFGRTGDVLPQSGDYLAFYATKNHAHNFSELLNRPTTLGGYGITDALPVSRTITINGITQDLTQDRTWTIATGAGAGAGSSSSFYSNDSVFSSHRIAGDYTKDLRFNIGRFSVHTDNNGGAIDPDARAYFDVSRFGIEAHAGTNQNFIFKWLPTNTPNASANDYFFAKDANDRVYLKPMPTYSTPIATASTLGGIRVGTGFSVNASTGVADVTPITLTNIGNGFAGPKYLIAQTSPTSFDQKGITAANSSIQIDDTGADIALQVRWDQMPVKSAALYTQTFGGTMTFNEDVSTHQKVTLTGNITSMNFANLADGETLYIIFKQDATGGRTVTGFPPGTKIQGGALTLTAAAGAEDMVGIKNLGGTLYITYGTDFK